MAIPRQPFGPEQPGRLTSTMLKVLAAEMSDAARLSRGQRYHADRAVTDIEVTAGVVRCEVQGARPDPYVVRLQVFGGAGTPLRSEVRVHCECPDADISLVRACKHGVAALFTLADEVAIEPEVLTRWRSGPPAPPRTTAGSTTAGSTTAGCSDVETGVEEDVDPTTGSARRSDPRDRFGLMLDWPTGTGPITIPRLGPWAQPAHSNTQLQEILSSAREALDLDWG
jgi:hypothetical protein